MRVTKLKKHRRTTIESFNLKPGTIIAGKYEVIDTLGGGWEGEVYLISEQTTGIERTAKLFYPHRNERDKASKIYAKKLHKLRLCPIVIQYHTREIMLFDGIEVSALISEFVAGDLLSDFIKRQPGKRLQPFMAMHLLHALAKGIECIHAQGDYHGDLHSDNVIVQRVGLGFELKLLDMFHWGAPSARNVQDDVLDLVRIFHESLGGRAHYAKQPHEVKAICCGLKPSLILKKFKTAGKLRAFLETMEWG